jgi:cytochrome c peroxidase
MHTKFPSWWAGGIALALFVASATAQRQHVNGLTGEPPDTSNWPHPAAPDGNPFVRSTAPPAAIAQRERIAQLGKALFWDEQVSIDNTMACGTCHDPRIGGTDGRPGAVHPNGNFGTFGVIPQALVAGNVDYGFVAVPSTQISRSVTPVNAPTMIGAYVFDRLFWDMRAGPDFVDELNVTIPNFTDWAALEDLAVGPPVNEVEMGHEGMKWSSGLLQKKLNTSFPLSLATPGTIPPDILWITTAGVTYARIFDNVFAFHPQFGGVQGVTRERFALAVAHYHRKLIPDRAPIDTGAMTRSMVRGFQLIQTRGFCFGCHSATGNPQLAGAGTVNPFDNPFSDGQFHFINLPGQPPRKTPTLRNIGLHQKFFSTGHGSDGIVNLFVTNFAQMIDFYNNQPGGLGFNPPLTAAEKVFVTDFLQNALTDPRVAAALPPFDKPQLYSETQVFEGNEYGVATPGPSGFLPEIIANSPPHVLQPGASDWFKLGVGDCPPGAPTMLMLGAAAAGGPQIWVGSLFATLIGPATNAQGIATIQQPVALVPAMIGIPFFAQWFVNDTGFATFSDAAVLTPF